MTFARSPVMPKMQSTSAVPASRPREGVHLGAWGGVAILAGLLSLRCPPNSPGPILTRGIMPYREIAMHRGARHIRVVHNLASESLDLNEARRAGTPGREPRGDPHALSGLAPAELHHAPRRVRDQRLGRLVAAHRCRLHSPHQTAAPDRLFAG